MTFSIVNTDNFGGDYPNEKFLLRHLTESAAKEISEIVNKHLCQGDHAPRYWKVVEDPYELSPGFEP